MLAAVVNSKRELWRERMFVTWLKLQGRKLEWLITVSTGLWLNSVLQVGNNDF